jgi:alkylhydroperoxidase/carboxymuconolactone decarboxylase family protein YurZ
MDVKHGARRIGGAVSDGTGLTPAEMGALVAVAVVAAGVIVAVRAVEVVHRHWTPSGGRS